MENNSNFKFEPENEKDQKNWKAYMFYFNRDDERIIVPKRYGIGGTLNFGNPKTYLFIGISMAVVLIYWLSTK